MLGEAQHPLTRARASARTAILLIGCTFTCVTASLVLAGQAPAADLETVTQAASPVTQTAIQAAAPLTQVTQAPQGPSGPTSSPTNTSTPARDRKSTRLNSSHPSISYAVFC